MDGNPIFNARISLAWDPELFFFRCGKSVRNDPLSLCSFKNEMSQTVLSSQTASYLAVLPGFPNVFILCLTSQFRLPLGTSKGCCKLFQSSGLGTAVFCRHNPPAASFCSSSPPRKKTIKGTQSPVTWPWLL